jgi:hypothetical protein
MFVDDPVELPAEPKVRDEHASLATFDIDDRRLLHIDEMGVAVAGRAHVNVRLM